MRRRLFVLLLCLFAAGLPIAADAMSAAMQADQMGMQHDDGVAPDCGGGMALGTCGIYCAAANCVVTVVRNEPYAVPSAHPVAAEKALKPACPSAPDTAPPKAALS